MNILAMLIFNDRPRCKNVSENLVVSSLPPTSWYLYFFLNIFIFSALKLVCGPHCHHLQLVGQGLLTSCLQHNISIFFCLKTRKFPGNCSHLLSLTRESVVRRTGLRPIISNLRSCQRTIPGSLRGRKVTVDGCTNFTVLKNCQILESQYILKSGNRYVQILQSVETALGNFPKGDLVTDIEKLSQFNCFFFLSISCFIPVTWNLSKKIVVGCRKNVQEIAIS